MNQVAKKTEEKATDGEKDYIPTKIEMAILEVVLDPANRLKNVSDICKLVPCDRKTYYFAFKKPGFAKLYRDEALEMVRRSVAPVLHACVREASRGSHNHAKIVLGMADMYHERKEVTGEGGGPVQVETIQRPQLTREEWLKEHGLMPEVKKEK